MLGGLRQEGLSTLHHPQVGGWWCDEPTVDGAGSLYHQLRDCLLGPVPGEPQALPYSTLGEGKNLLSGSPTSGVQEAFPRPLATRQGIPPKTPGDETAAPPPSLP